MRLEEFNFYLPEKLIAQIPLKKRDSSKCLVINRKEDKYEHKKFSDVLNYINKGDTLVLNNTRVMPARLIGKKVDTGAIIELLLLNNIEGNIWECLVKPAKRVKLGSVINFSDIMQAKCVKVMDDGFRYFELIYDGILNEKLDILGTMPLPPYIKESLKDKERYQTVFSKELGSSAAPTAGLHFTNKLLKKIKDKGINIVYITLHVGLGTFRPVVVKDIRNHHMHSEYYKVSKETADIINNTKKNGYRVITVGTTSTRTLESISRDNNGIIVESSGWTDIFIYPGFNFTCVDALITNFHLPKSSLIMLVSAFYSREKIIDIYNVAVKNNYRFFSFGDSMFIY